MVFPLYAVFLLCYLVLPILLGLFGSSHIETSKLWKILSLFTLVGTVLLILWVLILWFSVGLQVLF